MTEGEPKPKAVPSVPPTDAERALAKKLGRALGRQPTGAGALARQSTGANAVPSSRRSVPIAASSSPPTSDAPSGKPSSKLEFSAEKEAMLAARRASLNPVPAEQKSMRPTGRPATTKPRARASIVAFGVLLLLGVLALGGLYVQQVLRDRSPEGQVRNALLSWEFALEPFERDQAFGTLDQGAPATVRTAIELLTDASKAERADSNSQRTVQLLAHRYLMHYAELVKAAPPKPATEIAKQLLDGAVVGSDGWLAARDAWRAWLVEQQDKGAVPKG